MKVNMNARKEKLKMVKVKMSLKVIKSRMKMKNMKRMKEIYHKVKENILKGIMLDIQSLINMMEMNKIWNVR